MKEEWGDKEEEEQEEGDEEDTEEEEENNGHAYGGADGRTEGRTGRPRDKAGTNDDCNRISRPHTRFS